MEMTDLAAHRSPDALVTRKLCFVGPSRRTSDIQYG